MEQQEGHVPAEQDQQVIARLEAIHATRGKYADEFGEAYLAELRRDWPE